MIPDKHETDVMFRRWPDGAVDAVFPYLPSTPLCPMSCTAYSHVGQHGTADYDVVIGNTRPARPAEFAELAEELRRRGYKLRIIHRASRARILKLNKESR